MLVKELAGFRQDKELKVGWDEALLGNPELHYLEHLLLVPSAHALVAVHMKREARPHREVVEAIRQHGWPRGYPR